MKYVYLIQEEGRDVYKVGFTKHNPSKRLKELQTSASKKLVLVDYYKSKRAPQIEKVIHNTYSSCQMLEQDGEKLIGEWFRFDYQTRLNFKEICKKIDDNFAAIEELSTLNKKATK